MTVVRASAATQTAACLLALAARPVRVSNSDVMRACARAVRAQDDFLTTRGEALAFAHWDVEGMETEVLLGARHTLKRDRPLFSVELFVQRSSHRTRSRMFAELRRARYDAFLVEEPCEHSRADELLEPASADVTAGRDEGCQTADPLRCAAHA
eukprot:7376656-Prymnesium_polylepis.2